MFILHPDLSFEEKNVIPARVSAQAGKHTARSVPNLEEEEGGALRSQENVLRVQPKWHSRGPVTGLLCVVEEDYTKEEKEEVEVVLVTVVEAEVKYRERIGC